jgi:hypothetical protein
MSRGLKAGRPRRATGGIRATDQADVTLPGTGDPRAWDGCAPQILRSGSRFGLGASSTRRGSDRQTSAAAILVPCRVWGLSWSSTIRRLLHDVATLAQLEVKSRAQLAAENLFLRNSRRCTRSGARRRGDRIGPREWRGSCYPGCWCSLLTVVTPHAEADNRGRSVLFQVELLTAFPTFVRHEDQEVSEEITFRLEPADWT